MKAVLIDSDVVLDMLARREPFFADSAEVLKLSELGRVRGFVTAVALSNIHYVLIKLISREQIVILFKQMMQFLEVATIDKIAVLDALNSDFKDFEDGLQNYSAIQNSEISMIITRNGRDYTTSQLTIKTPSEFLREL